MPASASQPNTYSRRWFTTFLGTLDAALIEREVDFLSRQLPKPAFQSVLDLCCGTGRHLAPLAAKGYWVTGLDRDAAALHDAKDAMQRAGTVAGAPSVVRGDMRALPLATASLDAVICMWQSFGQFDTISNRRLLADIRRVLRPHGRFVLDVYHREFHEQRLAPRSLHREGMHVLEERTMFRDRLHVELRYSRENAKQDDQHQMDIFEWQLYTPGELAAEAECAGLALRLACTAFDELRPPSADEPRMQLIFDADTVGAPRNPHE